MAETERMVQDRWIVAAFAALIGLIAQGCFTGAQSDLSPTESNQAKTSVVQKTPGSSAAVASIAASSAKTQSGAAVPAPPGGVEPFRPPSLAELDAKADWQNQPVRDALELLRERQAQERPLCTAAEALALENTSAENNRKILSALGRLPQKDSDVGWDGTFIEMLPADVKSTNPVMISSWYEFELANLIGFELFGFDASFTPFAKKDAVVSWQTSKDRMCDKVVIRDDLVWSDGQPITAHDVAFSFRLIMDPRVPVPAERTSVDQLRWVEAYDDHTVVFFHKQAAATNVWSLDFYIVPEHIYQDYDDDPTLQNAPRFVTYENQPVVGGPYLLKEHRRNEELVLERREGYSIFRGKQVRSKPFFKTVRFRILPDTNTALLALKNAEIEEMQLIPLSLWRSQTVGPDFYKYNTKVQGVEWSEFQFIWNCETPYFSDKRVRQAMSYAFDYDEMLNTILGGLAPPCVGPFHPDAWMAARPAPQPYHQDLDKAEQLLKEAGWEDHDGDGVRDKIIDGQSLKFDFDIVCMSTDPDRIRISTLMKESLERIGVACTVRPVEFTVLQDMLLSHRFQATMGAWGSGTDPDTHENLYTTAAASNGRNYGCYSNPEVDELFREGKLEFGRDRRAQIYGKIHRLLWEDQPYTWLCYRPSLYAFNKKLRGYAFSPRGPFLYSPGPFSIWRTLQ